MGGGEGGRKEGSVKEKGVGYQGGEGEGKKEEERREGSLEGLKKRLEEAKKAEKTALSSLLETEDHLVSRLLKEELKKLEEEIAELGGDIQRLERENR